MDLTLILLIVITALLIFLVFKKPAKPINTELEQILQNLALSLQRIEANLKEDFKINREESSRTARENREDLRSLVTQMQQAINGALDTTSRNNQTTLKELITTVETKLSTLTDNIEKQSLTHRQELGANLKSFVDTNITQLDQIRKTVEESLRSLLAQSQTDNNSMRESLVKSFREFQEIFDKNVQSFNNLQREKFAGLEKKQDELISGTEKKLEQMRETVDEKLQKTLNERLAQSFETVGKQLSAVQEGLGEMRNLAQDVGGLKRVLTNVKTFGSFGEVQLSMLLEQILAPDQYEANVKTKEGSSAVVEFAVKLPGRDDERKNVYLPIDAKFPKDVYASLQDAYERGDQQSIEEAQKQLYNAIKKMAKDISEKYLDPPNTTDFGILFLPFEGIYAEVVRNASLLEDLRKDTRMIVTGPTTLAALLNSLQMGFRTLAIQKRSSEVWQILSAVKKEFENFGGLLDKAHKNIETGLKQLEDVKGRRTNAIKKSLRNVETTDIKLLPESEELFEEEENN